jgi:hypothetical protein
MGFNPSTDPNLNPGGVSTPGQPAAGAGGGPFGNPTAPPPNFTGMTTADLCKQPRIAFVVDGSGSMCEPFGGSTRWQELRTALLSPQESASPGLITRLHERAEFGMFIYSGSIDPALAGGLLAGGGSGCSFAGGGGGGECPNLVEVQPAIGNAGAISQAFPMREIGGSTPTDKAMNHVVDQMIASLQTVTDPAMHPQYIILATDGQPNDICMGGVGGDGLAQQQGVLMAADRAAAAGITTFVISLAGGDMALEQHLTQVAQHGDPNNPAAHSFTPLTPQDLIDTLVMLLGTAFGCNIG